MSHRADGPARSSTRAPPRSAWPPACSRSARSPGRCSPRAGHGPAARLLIGGARRLRRCSRSSPASPRSTRLPGAARPHRHRADHVNTAANATVQLATSPEMRGRVMGIYMLVFTGGAPIGAPLIGWISELGGPRAGVMLAGVLVLVGTGRRGAADDADRPGCAQPGWRSPDSGADRVDEVLRGRWCRPTRCSTSSNAPSRRTSGRCRACAGRTAPPGTSRWPSSARCPSGSCRTCEVRLARAVPPARRPGPGLHRVRGRSRPPHRGRVFWAGLVRLTR